MKILILLICVVSLVVAEPPVGDGYPSARTSHEHSHDHDHEHDHSNDFQRSLSQGYGPPSVESARSFQEDEPSREYLPPSAKPAEFRSSLAQTYGPPNARSEVSYKHGLPNSKSSIPSRDLSSKYGAPNTRSGPPKAYSIPAARSGLSQEYGVPSVRSNNARTPSDQYGVPEQLALSEEYGVPSQRSFGSAPSHKYGPPASRNSQSSKVHSARSGEIQLDHSTPRGFTKSFTSSNSRSPKGSSKFGARSSLTSSGYSTAKTSYSSNTETQSQTYETPNHRHLLDTYEVPSAKGLSQEYGIPENRAASQKSSGGPSINSAATRSSPSNTYGAPSVRGSLPSEQYGVPDQRSNLFNDSYSYARHGIDGALNEEPANYDFSYKVEDYESGSDFGHTETRQDNKAKGVYFVVLPDGTKQVVEYEADERGFKPRISVEPADFAPSAGYDHNAAELARSGDGPY